MKHRHKVTIAGFSAVTVAFLTAATPAQAGRCGHSYPVDEPITLAEVARQCNVRLTALYEANPGVDPRNVRPGEYLAIPDEITGAATLRAATPSTGAVTEPPQSNHPYIVSPNYSSSDYRSPITDDVGFDESKQILNARADVTRSTQRIRVRDRRIADASSAPTWLREESLGARHHSTADRLSYQQLSALRIKHAGLPTSPVRFVDATVSPSPNIQLIECPVLRKSDGGKIHKVRKIISTPDNTFVEIKAMPNGDGFDCRLLSVSGEATPLTPGVPAAHFTSPKVTTGYRLPDYSKIGDRPAAALSISAQETSLQGEIVDSQRGCLLLRTSDKQLRRLSTTQPADDLLGKHVTVWGAPTSGGACGDGYSMLVSHAVYAEPWPSAQR